MALEEGASLLHRPRQRRHRRNGRRAVLLHIRISGQRAEVGEFKILNLKYFFQVFNSSLKYLTLMLPKILTTITLNQ